MHFDLWFVRVNSSSVFCVFDAVFPKFGADLTQMLFLFTNEPLQNCGSHVTRNNCTLRINTEGFMSAKPTGLIENGDNVARSHRKLYDWQRSGFATMSGTLGIRDRNSGDT